MISETAIETKKMLYIEEVCDNCGALYTAQKTEEDKDSPSYCPRCGAWSDINVS